MQQKDNNYLEKLKNRMTAALGAGTEDRIRADTPSGYRSGIQTDDDSGGGGLCLKCMCFSVVNGVCTRCKTAEGSWKNPGKLLPPGTILSGQYVVGKVLGRGGFGVTYMGYDMKNRRKVAIKEYFPNLPRVDRDADGRTVRAGDAAYFSYGLGRFCEEGQMIYRYRTHPNIVHVSKLFRENSTAYYAMEYLEGEDLSHYRMRSGGQIDYNELLLLILPVMDALSCIHRDFVIHRDVSPDNIFIGKTVKLIDFGASRISAAGQSHSLSVILKQPFAPEEQYRKRGRQGAWTDIYALCATIYFCLTGQLIPEALSRRDSDSLRDIRSYGLNLPEYSAQAIMRGLSVRADDRYHTVDEFRAAFLGEGDPAPYSVCPLERFRLYGIRGRYAGTSLVESGILTIGRDPAKCSLLYPEETQGVSRQHAVIWLDGEKRRVMLRDDGSTYGTFVNGIRLRAGEEKALNSSDRILFGGAEEFEIEY